MASQITVTPISTSAESSIDFGAIVPNVDVENISDADFDVIRDALFTHQVLVFKNQNHLSPKAQYEITQRFDPEAAGSYGHGKTIDKDLDFTRFYRWHIDAALYGLAPPVVTSLLAVRVPGGRKQTLVYDDGSNEELTVPLGTTAFVSGYAMYDRLSPEDKEFVRTTKVEYAPHPYVWMSGAKSRSDGLGLVSEGKEIPVENLPPVEEDKIQILPMCWRNPVTGRLALQVHPSAVRKLHLADGTVIDDLTAVRERVHELQRPGIAPEKVYPHDWEQGDLVLFHNRGVIHSVVGAFAEDEVRLFRQCNIAGSKLPEGPTPVADGA
ncbi:TauD/TfdA-like domain [Fusarium oxysporum f. sp. vasinfectum]|nr:TauD/TfdA-like domain [Fusarium oxysporum f. sp. vasinfectum]WKT44344.1 TauD/TfdA-like domain [Fusarium oxysporum f. sp. vasinfectum]